MSSRSLFRSLLLATVLFGAVPHSAWALDEYLNATKAVKGNDVEGLRAQIVRGDDMNHQDDQGKTALMYAAVAGNETMIKLLLQGGARPLIRDQDGRVALHWAVQRDNPDAVSALLDGGAPIDTLDPHGTTPLMMAAAIGNLAVIRVLISHHPKLDARDYTGRSAVDFADGTRQSRAATLLKQAGAS
ncbi:MAG: ankyrin repeat family protein [Rhodospirillales bacterium]|jgi:ankyrin repeat protein|nr:ankyrin repeat family protein [Rhodospirillales bacterium]